MSTTTLYLTGKIEWAQHLFEPDDYLGVKKYKVDFYPTEQSLEDLVKSGSRKKIGDGTLGKRVRLDRPFAKDWGKGKGLEELGPPEILTSEGKPWPKDTIIGNGSEVTVKVVVYDTRMGKGTRLEAVRIDELVPYESSDSPSPISASTPEDGIPF